MPDATAIQIPALLCAGIAAGSLLTRWYSRPRRGPYCSGCRHQFSYHENGSGPCNHGALSDFRSACACRIYAAPVPGAELARSGKERT